MGQGASSSCLGVRGCLELRVLIPATGSLSILLHSCTLLGSHSVPSLSLLCQPHLIHYHLTVSQEIGLPPPRSPYSQILSPCNTGISWTFLCLLLGRFGLLVNCPLHRPAGCSFTAGSRTQSLPKVHVLFLCPGPPFGPWRNKLGKVLRCLEGLGSCSTMPLPGWCTHDLSAQSMTIKFARH